MKVSICKNTRRLAFPCRALPIVAVLALSFAVAFPSACQTIYKWSDVEGVTRFSDTPPPADGRLIEKFQGESRRESLPPEDGEDQALAELSRFKVSRVYDGDSFEAEGYNITVQVRIVGIDSPETGKKGRQGQPFSRRAKNFLEKSIGNRVVHLKGYGSDSYNRQLAEVFADGNNVGLSLVEAGLAETYGGVPPRGFDSEPYKNAEARAKKARLGIWSLGDRYESPYHWRKRMR